MMWNILIAFGLLFIPMNAFAGDVEALHPELRVLLMGIKVLKPDTSFKILETIRTEADQAEAVRQGRSKTMESLHIKQPDGWAHAVDLVPVVEGRLSWDWADVFIFVNEVRDVAKTLNLRIRWGGCWEDITATKESLADLVHRYKVREQSQGRQPLLDGLHFELVGE
jgi:peptidoglycan LD-endopeptidase CwlK